MAMQKSLKPAVKFIDADKKDIMNASKKSYDGRCRKMDKRKS